MIKFRHSSHYPISFDEYCSIHQKHGGHSGCFVKDRYVKAKFVYNCMKFPENTWDSPELREWWDFDLGYLKQPEDAFRVWWDV